MVLQFSNFILGLIISIIIGGLAYKSKSLSKGGLAGAVIIGTSIFGFGGWQYFLLLILFFLSSSFLTKYRYRSKQEIGVAEFKAGARNIWQTVGQGGVGAILVFLAYLYPQLWTPLILAFVSSIGEANGDTWAVEIGVLSKKRPKLITDLRKEVPPGTSGGVTVLGETAALLGAAFIAIIASIIGVGNGRIAPVFLFCMISAFLGEHVDSLLGATIQAMYYCPTCRKETEKKIHRCGTRGELRRGIAIMNNEFVNFASTSFTAIISLVFSALFFMLF